LSSLGHLWKHHRNVHGFHKFSKVRRGAERNQALIHRAQVLCRDLADLPFRQIGRRKVDAFSFSNPPSVYEFILPIKQAPPFPAPFRLGSLESSASHPFDISFGWPAESCLGDNTTMAGVAMWTVVTEKSIHLRKKPCARPQTGVQPIAQMFVW
jgi:hypothetical protein